MGSGGSRPSGTVTFLVTDIEGSTKHTGDGAAREQRQFP
jgi:hypothetical protein